MKKENLEIQTIEPSTDLGILVGLLLTDGSISWNKKSWIIELTGKSLELHDLFKEKLQRIFGKLNFTEITDSRDFSIKRTKLTNKNIGELLLKFVQKSNPKLPEFILRLSSANISKILQVMFSADGAICLWTSWNKKKNVWEIRKRIKIACKNSLLREQITQLLQNLGFDARNRPENEEVVLWKQKDIVKFKEEIGFVSGIKVTKNSKNWREFEKNQILDLAIKTFDLKKKDLQQFKTKEEVISFLKSFSMAPVTAS